MQIKDGYQKQNISFQAGNPVQPRLQSGTPHSWEMVELQNKEDGLSWAM